MNELKGFDLAVLRYKLAEVENYLDQARTALANGNALLTDNTLQCAVAFLADARQITEDAAQCAPVAPPQEEM